MKSNKEYQADSDQRKRDKGLTKVCLWIPNTEKAKESAKRYAARLVKQEEKA